MWVWYGIDDKDQTEIIQQVEKVTARYTGYPHISVNSGAAIINCDSIRECRRLFMEIISNLHNPKAVIRYNTVMSLEDFG